MAESPPMVTKAGWKSAAVMIAWPRSQIVASTTRRTDGAVAAGKVGDSHAPIVAGIANPL